MNPLQRWLGRGLLVLGLSASGAWAAQASGSLALEQAIQEARDHSPRLARARAVSAENRGRRTEALSGFLPRLTLGANHYLEAKYQTLDIQLSASSPMVTIPQVYPRTSFTLDALVPVFDGLASINRWKAADLGAVAAEKEEGFALFQLDQEVRLHFYRALAAQQLEAVAQQNVTTLEDHLHRAQAQKQAGVATHYDVLRVEVQVNEARSEALQAADNRVLARMRLAEVLAGEEADTRALAGDLPLPDARRIEKVEPRGLEKRPDLQALELRSEAAGRQHSAAWASVVSPRVSLGGQLMSYNNHNASITDGNSFRTAYNLGVFVSWPFFDGAASIGRSAQAAAQVEQADAQLRAAVLKAAPDFEFWRRRYVYSTQLHLARQGDVDKSLEAVRLATVAYQRGARTTSEVLDAELELFRARAGVVTSRLGAAEALINLELILGAPIAPERN